MPILTPALLAGLRRRYAEPHRAYHGQRHIDMMLALLARRRADLQAPEAVELAIWYHDAIYDPAARDNEAASAALLRTELGATAEPSLLRRAEGMIIATSGHSPTQDADCAAFLDMDLAILGADAVDYAWYEAGIRREYEAVPPDAYRAGRSAVLNGFLAWPHIYTTAWFRDRLESIARRNIAAALRNLVD